MSLRYALRRRPFGRLPRHTVGVADFHARRGWNSLSSQAQPATDNGAALMEEAPADSTTYEFLLQRLYQVNRFTAVKLGLENMKALHAAFGEPAAKYEIVHVAGTNGKGSVSFKIAKALERSGYRTGLFVSPHVSCYRERIQVNGTLISEAEVTETLAEIFNVSAQLRIPATFFEITTMLALQHFAKQQVDCVVLETGLGGRLDSTNIVTPALSVITSIGMDHTRILGNTREQIAREKAGIIKPQVPVVVGPQTPLEIMADRAQRVDAPLVAVPFQGEFAEDFNAENTAIAREACIQLNQRALAGQSELQVDLDSQRVVSALESRPPCRFEVFHIVRPNSTERKVTIVLDVAHNPPAIERLVQLLTKRFPQQKMRFVCGFSADKDMAKAIKSLLTLCNSEDYVHLVKANHPRGASLEEVNLALTQDGQGIAQFSRISSVEDGVKDAVAAARMSNEDEVVVVCGSVFLMAEARKALGFKEPADSPAVNAVAGSHLSTPASRLASGTHAYNPTS
ncbi:TPA: hypothetical protein N0F65_004132 [Lagenidium giganteum]|uniref:Mur ligase central domain-containing protein n=1 Tax=Lagenidium giganteum TaxID=4803 RepID=A0AAV2ZCL0_9STRA|nr:TPA: hypothetical protein N0F65_004132 [Lagenidium giganteum]